MTSRPLRKSPGQVAVLKTLIRYRYSLVKITCLESEKRSDENNFFNDC